MFVKTVSERESRAAELADVGRETQVDVHVRLQFVALAEFRRADGAGVRVDLLVHDQHVALHVTFLLEDLATLLARVDQMTNAATDSLQKQRRSVGGRSLIITMDTRT